MTMKRHNILSWRSRSCQNDYTLCRECYNGRPLWVVYDGYAKKGNRPGERVGTLTLTPTFRLRDFVHNLKDRGHEITFVDHRWVR